MFREVVSKVRLAAVEEEVLGFWKENRIFQKSLETRKDAPRYVFYEGPPTANGRPGLHHVLARAFKDLFPRYHTMKGCYVLRKAGWDTHGLPVELEIERELGFTSKADIEAYGVAAFNQKCRESVFRYVEEWRRMTERIGFWLDMDSPYITLSNDYIESLWWIVKQLWDKGLIYQSYKVVPYCPRCGTPVSSHEVALGYEMAKDPSIYVKFPWRDEPGLYFLSWTTTPWTLPGNVALAVHPEVEYVLVEQDGERLVLARELINQVLQGSHRVVRSFRGRELVGKHYRPLYTFLPVSEDYCRVVAADFVSTKEGTGIVHIAPAFGEEDLEVGRKEGLPIIQTVDLKGCFVEQVRPWRGIFVKDADPFIVDDLAGRGLLYRSGSYEHIYPFCWRCDTPLLYYAKTSWFIETSRMRQELLYNNQLINWYPSHIKNGRFGNWLENNVDWALGRERFWGTPMPIWVCPTCGRRECLSSIAELSQRVGRDLCGLDLHRPYVDEVTFPCPEGHGEMRRVPEVLDCWFDAGSMPLAQWHYPFQNQELFREQFPADFICEAVDQTRGWFYTLHAISTLLLAQPCYRNVICLGLVLDAEGQKMSKSRGNVVDPWEVITEHGADALRWYLYTATPPGNERRFSKDLVGEVVRKFFLTLWNTYSFFVTYANIDGFNPTSSFLPGSERSTLDRWITSELNLLAREVDEGLAQYEVTGTARAIQEFVESLSNWYVRRSRRRFWKSEQDLDKVAAYLTLYECLVTVAKLLAPYAPFIAEDMYQNLVRSVQPGAPESVHLAAFPTWQESLIDRQLVADTRLVMELASIGRAARAKAGIKLRQPLRRALVKVDRPEEREGVERLKEQILDELNVEELTFIQDEGQVVSYFLIPRPDVLGPKYGPLFPKIRARLGQRDVGALAKELQAGRSVRLEVDERWVELVPEEVEVQAIAKEGYSLSAEGGYLVAVETALSPELVSEGLAREVVRRIQNMRKEAGFRIEDNIIAYYQTDPALRQVIKEYGDYIRRETLSVQLVEGAMPVRVYGQEFIIAGHPISIEIGRTEVS